MYASLRKKGCKPIGVVQILLGLMALSGCARIPAHYIHPTYDFSLIQKVAVLPLENLTQDRLAGEKVRKVVVSEFLAVGVVDVIEPGQVNHALAQQGIEAVSSMSAKEFKRLGSSLGVQAFIVGSVGSYERISVGGVFFPEVTITLRAVDAVTGTIIWSASHTEGGVGVAGRLFGLGVDTMSQAVQKTVRATVITLFR